MEDYFRHYCTIGTVTDLSKFITAEQKADSTTTKQAMVIQKFLAVAFVEQADSARYQPLWRELKNNLTLKQDNYLTSLAELVHMLTHWKNSTENQRSHFSGNP